jgi:hypothetical protein
LEAWLPVTFAVNSINRSMGIDGLYPFVISPEVTEKLKAVHQVAGSYGRDRRPLAQRLMHLISF